VTSRAPDRAQSYNCSSLLAVFARSLRPISPQITDDRIHHLARVETAGRAEVEHLARAECRRPEVIATCGHALLVATKSA